MPISVAYVADAGTQNKARNSSTINLTHHCFYNEKVSKNQVPFCNGRICIESQAEASIRCYCTHNNSTWFYRKRVVQLGLSGIQIVIPSY